MLTEEEKVEKKEEKKEEFSIFGSLVKAFRKPSREKPVADKIVEKSVVEGKIVEATPVEEVEPEVIERYYVGDGNLASVAIVVNPDTKQQYYKVEQPAVTEGLRDVINEVEKIFVHELRYDPAFVQDRSFLERYLEEGIKKALKRYGVKLTPEDKNILQFYVKRNYLGYGPVDIPMQDPNIEDVTCDGVGGPVYVWHRKYESLPTDIAFSSMEEVDDFVSKLAHMSGKHVSVAFPIVDAELPDRSRLATTYRREISHKGSSFSIRKFRSSPFTIVDLLSFGTLDLEIAAYFWLLIENKKSVIIAGSTAAGKTTTINSLATFIHPKYRIITIEDTAELNLPHEHWLPLVVRSGFGFAGEKTAGEITQHDLLKASLRHRPDYIIVGEIRGAEAYVLFQAMATGHGGICTIHAGSVDEVTKRLTSQPMNIAPVLLPLISAVAIQVQFTVKQKRVRKIIAVYELLRSSVGEKDFEAVPIFTYDPSKDIFVKMNPSSHIVDLAVSQGWSQEDLSKEIQRRKTMLKWLLKKDIRYYKDVGNGISSYYNNPTEVYRKTLGELYPFLADRRDIDIKTLSGLFQVTEK